MYTPRNKSWFSLVELLIAMTLLGLLMWGIVHFVSGWVRVVQKTGSEMTKTEADRAVESNLLKLSILPASRVDDGGSLASGGSGAIFDTDGSLSFVWTITRTGYCANEPTLPLEFLRMRSDAGSSSGETIAIWPYRIGDSGYSVYSGSVRILGTGVMGGVKGWAASAELAGATSLALSGTTLAVADPANDRVMFYGTSDSSLSFLEARNSGIFWPESLEFYSDGLYIGARNGTFRLQDWGGAGSILDSSIGTLNTSLVAGGFRVTFSPISTLVSPSSTAQVTLSKHEAGVWSDVTALDDTITPSWSGFTWTFSGGTRTLNLGIELRLHVQDITPLPTSVWQHTATISFLDAGGTPVLSRQIPYVTIGDGSIPSSSGNVIERITQESRSRKVLWWMSSQTGSLQIDDFLERNWVEQTTSYPIRDFHITETWTHTVISYTQYLSYDCLDGAHTSRKQIWVIRKK